MVLTQGFSASSENFLRAHEAPLKGDTVAHQVEGGCRPPLATLARTEALARLLPPDFLKKQRVGSLCLFFERNVILYIAIYISSAICCWSINVEFHTCYLYWSVHISPRHCLSHTGICSCYTEVIVNSPYLRVKGV